MKKAYRSSTVYAYGDLATAIQAGNLGQTLDYKYKRRFWD